MTINSEFLIQKVTWSLNGKNWIFVSICDDRLNMDQALQYKLNNEQNELVEVHQNDQMHKNQFEKI